MYLHIDYEPGRHCGIIKSDFLPQLRKHFSAKDKAAHIRKFHNRFAPSRRYAITPAGRFLVGLFGEIYKYTKKLKQPIDLKLSPEFQKVFWPSYPPLNTSILQLDLALRDYQEICVQKCIKQGNGTIVLATAGGKTLLMGSLLRNVEELVTIPNHSTVIIVPTIQLVEQVKKDFVEYGIAANKIAQLSGQHEFHPYRPITIVLSQYLVTSTNVPNQIFNANLLLVDEVQSAKKSNKLNKFVRKFVTPHKFGLTGSLPEEKIDKWGVIGTFGPIIYEKDSHSLRKEGYLADVQTVILRLHYKDEPDYQQIDLSDPLVNYEIERNFLVNHSYRNQKITTLATKTEKNTLIIVDRIEHGLLLEKLLKSAASNKTIRFIRGSVELDEREQIRKLMETKDNFIVIAIAKIFAIGINIKNLHYIFLVTFGKAKTRLVQSIGRGLRLHPTKTKLYMFDFADQLRYSISHLKKRVQIYKQEKIPYVVKDIFET